VAFIAVVAVSVVAFASLGGVGLAQSALGLVQYQYGKKVTICHKGKTIKISTRAWPAHNRHGDEVGTCAALKAHAKSKAHAKAAAAQGKQGKQGGHGKKSELSSQPVAETTSDAGKGQGNKGQSGKSGGGNGKSQGGKHDD